MATPTSDPYLNVRPDLGSPVYQGAFAITPGTALAIPPRAIYVGGAGTVTAAGQDGVSVTFSGLAAGQILPFRASAVSAATATGLLGLY